MILVHPVRTCGPLVPFTPCGVLPGRGASGTLQCPRGSLKKGFWGPPRSWVWRSATSPRPLALPKAHTVPFGGGAVTCAFGLWPSGASQWPSHALWASSKEYLVLSGAPYRASSSRPSWASWWPSHALWGPPEGVLCILRGPSPCFRLSALMGLFVAFARPSGPSRRCTRYPRGPLIMPPSLNPRGLSCSLCRVAGASGPPIQQTPRDRGPVPSWLKPRLFPEGSGHTILFSLAKLVSCGALK